MIDKVLCTNHWHWVYIIKGYEHVLCWLENGKGALNISRGSKTKICIIKRLQNFSLLSFVCIALKNIESDQTEISYLNVPFFRYAIQFCWFHLSMYLFKLKFSCSCWNSVLLNSSASDVAWNGSAKTSMFKFPVVIKRVCMYVYSFSRRLPGLITLCIPQSTI